MRPAVLCIMLPVLFAAASPAAGLPDAAEDEGKPSWWNRTSLRHSEHYLIETDLSLVEARGYARHLDLLHEGYSARLAFLPARAPEELRVYLFRSREDYLQTLRMRWGIDGEGTGGMSFATAEGSRLALFTDDLPLRRVYHVLQHEGFHQFAHSRFGDDLPMWLNEGLAEYFGRAVPVGDRLLTGQATPRLLDDIKRTIGNDEHIPFSRMLTLAAAEWNEQVKSRRADVLYKQAWSMVQFLIHGDGGRYEPSLARYLKQLNAGIPSGQAFTEIFGPDIGAFEKRWKQHALEAGPGSFITALERIEFLAEGARELSRRGVVPESLDELRAQLRAIDFQHTAGHHDVSVTLRAADDASFIIPMDDLTDRQPFFVIEKPTLYRQTSRERDMEAERPTPPDIETKHLLPRDLSVRWTRNEASAEFDYEIIVR